MARFKYVNNELIEITGTELTQLEAKEQAWNDGALDRALENLRKQRNIKLSETDFYALSDVTMSSEMSTYRQDLRDLPNNYTTSDSSELAEDLSNLIWPTKP